MSSTRHRVVVVSLGRERSMGEAKRVASLELIFERAGAEVVPVRLLHDFRARVRDVADVDLVSLGRGAASPESLAWSRRRVLRHLEALQPDLVVCVTGRAYHPSIGEGQWVTVLDLVDCLSTSYGDRSRIAGFGARRAMYRSLAWSMRRFEDHAVPPSVTRIAAGWSDAAQLGATWVPITIEIPPRAEPERAMPVHDLVFFGNLSYPPNLEAVESLARIWPRLTAARPAASLLLAGAHPDKRVVELSQRLGWTLVAGFTDVSIVLSQARLGVVPLVHASGIQIKVLEAAAFGLAQVVSPAARAGLGPGFPVEVAEGERAFAERVLQLLEDDEARVRLGAAARAHMSSDYAADRWTGWATALLSPGVADPSR